ncbi:MAG: preprotein translocase subunit SecY [Lachnospiraceae bacterium]|uniref:Protein translocase subunit SecY n=1 Tax=Candidatus Weimeria bifida TaxID=2599074 RepID=A0A6N7IWQ5_9FIRM|nr:preprotein translocase subunit SecY [Candidatus Weimeria bifida]RRF94946.1 MAG: preprotein translocase subunit SecY [Lachnospiraceae bacterium]
MFQTIRDAFKIKEIRKRLIFTFLMLIVVRIGSQLPLPGVDPDVFKQLFGNTGDSLNFFNAITGGSFEQMSVFALSITPYITSTIIIQLLTISFPKLEEMQRDGEEGRKKLSRITRYVTIGLAVMEALAMAIGFGRSGYLSHYNFPFVLMMVTVLTAGASALMWIGDEITRNGVGNGISIILVINIVSRFPQDATTLYNQFIKGQTIARGILIGVIIAAIIVGLVVMVVVLQCAERRIPVQYSRRLQGVGRNTYSAANSTFIPLKVNTGGVMPVIFAQSLMQAPVIIAALAGKSSGKGVGYTILYMLSESHWFTPSNWFYTIGAAVYVLLLIAFAYFYTSITFNPLEIADNMKKSGGFVPGIRPGKPTSDYLQRVLNSIIFIGAIGLTIVSILPIMLNGLTGANVSFGGTSIIIVVGVVVETVKQIEGQMMVRNYKGFLTD